MYDGYIILALLAILLAFGLSRMGRRVRLPFSITGAIVVFILVVLMLWAVGQG